MSASIPSWARPGQKVMCVDDHYHPERFLPNLHYWGLDGLTKGTIYTIREIGSDGVHPGVGLRLLEIERGLNFVGFEAVYSISRFRPLVSIEDDIATHFAQHLTAGQPRTVEAVE